MFTTGGNTAIAKTTSHKAVIPFYLYASVSFLAATILLFISRASFGLHFFNPHTLALTHLLALGWGTMIILGASHQLVPVLTGSKLYSEKIAFLTFLLTGCGIPLLAGAFYFFETGWLMLSGAILINSGVLLFLLNILQTIRLSKKENIHAIFLFTATLWLLLTTLFGLCLVINFTHPFLSPDLLRYIPLHAHMGIVGWFLLLIIGVGSRLIPLFLISKFTSDKLLWLIFMLINAGLAGFLADYFFTGTTSRLLLYTGCVTMGILCFAFYCVQSFRQRIRRKVDEQMKASLIAVALLFLPVVALSFVLVFFHGESDDTRLVHLYGFTIFMGWLTALIFGMSFKTFPFIVWNKIYHQRASKGQTPSPKELFSDVLFRLMMLSYFAGFLIAGAGIFLPRALLIEAGTFLLALAALLYNLNMFKVALHRPS